MATPQHHTQHRNLLRPAPDDDTIASSGDGDAGSDGGGPAVEVTSIKSRKPGQWRLMATRSIDMLLLCTSTNMAQLPHVDPQGNECTGCGRRNVERPGSCGHTFGMPCSACQQQMAAAGSSRKSPGRLVGNGSKFCNLLSPIAEVQQETIAPANSIAVPATRHQHRHQRHHRCNIRCR